MAITPDYVREVFKGLKTGDGAVLVGHAGGKGIPALLLHGGPGLSDYTEGCAAELGVLFSAIRYTQRGIAPSSVQGPYTVEQHMADALNGYTAAKARLDEAKGRLYALTGYGLPFSPDSYDWERVCGVQEEKRS